jgi:hypothetical protein
MESLILKKVKRNTIDDALIASNLESYANKDVISKMN